MRGAFSRIAELTPEERARGVVTCSAGNHAAGVALAARELGTNALVMMPSYASQAKVDATRAYGGTADLESADAAVAFARMHAESEATGRVIVHPFEDRAVMAGQGTLGLELCEQVEGVTQVVVPVGGGGLISGVATAVKALAPQARVIGVEPAVISTLGASIAAGEPLLRPAGKTVADALAPPALGRAPLAVLGELLDEAVAVSEEQIADGLPLPLCAREARGRAGCGDAGRSVARGPRRAAPGHGARALGRQRRRPGRGCAAGRLRL